MARMSIDSKFRNDPRVLRLAKALGWSRRETMGCLFDVWAICYDRVDEHLPVVDLNEAAAHDGFDRILIACGLGRETKRGIRIAGARERIKYLRDAKKHGREGGRKSADMRRNRGGGGGKGGSSHPQGSGNPPDRVPDPDGDIDPDGGGGEPPDPDAATAIAELARRLASPPPLELAITADWEPRPTAENIAAAKGAERRRVVVEYARRKFVEHAQSKDWTLVDIEPHWRKWLLTELPTPLAIVESLSRSDREAKARAARDRERAADGERQQRAEADRDAVRRAAKSALKHDYQPEPEEATG